MRTSKPTAPGAASLAWAGALLVGLCLALPAGPVSAQSESRYRGQEGPAFSVLRDRIEILREENAQLRRRVLNQQDQLTRLETQLPHFKEQLGTRIDGLDQHLEDRANNLQSTLGLYMRVGTFVLILIGVFGFGYIHQMLRSIIERSVNGHLRSDEFRHKLGEKVEQVAAEAQDSILEASKEETRQLTRKLIDEFLTEERNRIEAAVQDEQEALQKLRTEHLDLQSPVPPETGEYLERVASAVHDRSLELLTDDELYYAMLDADSKSDHLEAERYARELLRRHPSTADSLSNLAWILEHSGRVAEAEAHYKRALEADPARHDVARYYAYLLDTQGRHEEARAILEGVLKRQPNNPRAISQYANFLVRRGHPEEAEPLLARALEDQPHDRCLLTSSALLLRRTGRTEEAMTRLREALGVAPDDLSLLLELAQLELETQALEAAEGHVNRALELAPDNVEGVGLHGRIDLHRGRFGEAETAFRQALTNDGTRPYFLGLLGLALLGQGRRAEATDVYNQALELAREGDAIERDLLQPLRELASRQELPSGEDFTAWLEEAKQATGGGSPGESEASQS